MDGTAVRNTHRWVKPALLIVAIAAMFVTWLLLPIKSMLQDLLQWMEQLGGMALVALAVMYILACVLLVPGSILTLGAGFLAATIWSDNLVLAIALGTVLVGGWYAFYGIVFPAILAYILTMQNKYRYFE